MPFASLRRKSRRALLGSALLLGGIPPAHAEDAKPDKALLEARTKFRQAISLQTGGNWAGALSLFRDVAAVKNTPQVHFNIAICEENLGQLVQALGDYQLAASQAREEGAADVASEVEGRLATLQDRIPKVVIQRDPKVGFARISIDGTEVGSSTIGKPLPVDPGEHVVSAESKGFQKFEKAIEVTERQAVTVQVTMVAAPEGAAAPAASGEGAAGDRGAPSEPKGTNLVPFIVGGIGAASLVTSGVFFYLRQKSISDLDAACPSRTGCSPSLESKAQNGRTYGTVAFVTLGVGIAGLGTGAALFFLGSGSPKGSEQALVLTPAAPLADVGASLRSRF